MLIFKEVFKTQSDQNIYQNAPNCTKFLLENSHFLFKVISKYTANRISCETLPNISLRELPHS